MKYISRHVRIWAICLLSVFATYYGAVMLFAHVHVVNGVMLVHSHPFNKQHTHAGGQALTLHFLSTFSTIEPEMAHWVTPVCPVLYVLSGDMDLWHGRFTSCGVYPSSRSSFQSFHLRFCQLSGQECTEKPSEAYASPQPDSVLLLARSVFACF